MKNVNKKNTQSKEIKNIVFLVCGNSGVGKKSIVNEWKKKLKFQKEDDMHFYQNYFFTVFNCIFKCDLITFSYT